MLSTIPYLPDVSVEHSPKGGGGTPGSIHPATIINDEELVQASLLRSGLQSRPAVSFLFYAVAFSIFLVSAFLSSRHLSK